MKKIFTFLSFIGIPLFMFSQQTINGTVSHDGLQREYILYIPANYTGNTAVPLVFNFHGFGSNASEQMFYGDFRPIADTEGFMIVHPEGTLFNGTTHWNVGGWTNGSTVDDVGFTEAMIDQLSGQYNIDPARIYSTGMSNGGFMSFQLACQLSDKIAAVASVTGSMTPEIFNNCDPQHPTPILQIHGTMDAVVPYNGQNGMKSIDEVLQYWVDFNNCNTDASVSDVPNINTTDGSSAEHYVHFGGDFGAKTEHFKVIGGAHTWPGSAFSIPGTNQDFDASHEIWEFFSEYNLTSLSDPTNVDELSQSELIIYPNPTSSNIYVENNFFKQSEYKVISTLGELKLSGVINSNNQEINLVDLSPNIYFLIVGNKAYRIIKSHQ